jgi:hypothetical protein
MTISTVICYRGRADPCPEYGIAVKMTRPYRPQTPRLSTAPENWPPDGRRVPVVVATLLVVEGGASGTAGPEASAGSGVGVLEVAAVRRRDRRGMQVARHRPQDRLPVAGGERWPAAGAGSRVVPLEPVPLAAGAAADCHPPGAGTRGARDRPAARSVPVDGQPGVASQSAAARPWHLRRRPGPRPRPRSGPAAATPLLSREPELRRIVQEKLELEWSPAQIAAHLRETYPERPAWHLCHETIYQGLYHGERAA